ncbi:hypothetical protein [Sporosarcina ureilytica]|uniref:Uncharacterized protein n=1 Tax=Sporosarcina ureilytica TaxID=298596 RepID=A0A1D8JJN9_9BACL|nr:hypothetical protein [Sporosarcina ureilytica]AOV08926.1 hypothetical protein BI350_16140 [Sporosarcina ureilytica]
MKKKIIIAGVVLLLIGVWGYSSVSQSSTNTYVEKEWELSSKQIEGISLNKAEQNIKAVIQESDDEKTTISLSGNVSEQAEKALANSISTDNKLDINFSEKGGVKLLVTSEGKDELLLTINLAKDAAFKELDFNMTVGSVSINVPENFDGKYKTKAEGAGEVLAVPQTNETMDSLIQVKTIGSINIEK